LKSEAASATAVERLLRDPNGSVKNYWAKASRSEFKLAESPTISP